MYKWGGVVTDRSVGDSYSVFREIVGRNACWRVPPGAEPGSDDDGAPGAGADRPVVMARLGRLDVTGRIHNRGRDRLVLIEVTSDDPASETAAERLLARCQAGFVTLTPGRSRPPRPMPRISLNRTGLVAVTTAPSQPTAGPGPTGSPGELTELLEWAGEVVLEPWQLGGPDPDLLLDQVLDTVRQLTGDPRLLLRHPQAGGAPADGMLALGTAAVAARWGGPVGDQPEWPLLLDTVVRFLRANHVERARVPSWAWDHYLAAGGDEPTWAGRHPDADPGRATGPAADPPPPTQLEDHEVRLLAVTGPGARVLVTCRGSGHVVLDDTDTGRDTGSYGEPGGGDPGLVFVLTERDDLYDCYQQAAWATPYRRWADAELEPFFPTPRPLI